MHEVRAMAKRITRHSPLTVAAIITAVTRGLNMSISEGLLSEAEQFAKMVPTCDLNRALDAWIHRRSAHNEVSEPAKGRVSECLPPGQINLLARSMRKSGSHLPFPLPWPRHCGLRKRE